jgi:hypothetical protein
MGTRTWVSGVGDDANPGSRTAPCKTFAGAISKTIAPGEIDVLDPGGFGAITITKAVTIDGAGTFASILGSGTTAVIVNAGPNDVVTLRNLSINGSGSGLDGIHFLVGAALHLENCVIFGFLRKGIFFEPNSAARLFITDSIIRDNNDATNGGGVLIQPRTGGSANAVLDGVRLHGNHFGLTATDRSNVALRNCWVAGSKTVGVAANATAENVVIELDSCMVVENNIGPGTIGLSANGAKAFVQISNVSVTNNNNGLSAVNNGKIVSWKNNRVSDNAAGNTPTTSLDQV